MINRNEIDIIHQILLEKRYSYYKWRCESSFVYKMALGFAFAGFTGICAQLRVYLPFTPVPITGQVFAVL